MSKIKNKKVFQATGLIFLKIQDLIRNTQINNTNTQEIAIFNNILAHDVNLATSISARYGDLRLEMPGDKTIEYIFNDDNVIREWDGLEQKFYVYAHSTEFNAIDRRNKFVNEIIVDFSYENLSFPIYIYNIRC